MTPLNESLNIKFCDLVYKRNIPCKAHIRGNNCFKIFTLERTSSKGDHCLIGWIFIYLRRPRTASLHSTSVIWWYCHLDELLKRRPCEKRVYATLRFSWIRITSVLFFLNYLTFMAIVEWHGCLIFTLKWQNFFWVRWCQRYCAAVCSFIE